MNRKCVVQTRFCGQLTPRASRVIALKLTRGVSCSGVEGDGSETFIGQVPEAELMFDRFDRLHAMNSNCPIKPTSELWQRSNVGVEACSNLRSNNFRFVEIEAAILDSVDSSLRCRR